MIFWFWCPGFSNAVHDKRNITVVEILNRTPELTTRVTSVYCFYCPRQQRFHLFLAMRHHLLARHLFLWWLHHHNQPAMTEPSPPSDAVSVTAASHQSAAASHNSLSTSSSTRNDDNEEEEAPLSAYYCRVYFESKKAGSKDLRVLFAMAEGHVGQDIPMHTPY